MPLLFIIKHLTSAKFIGPKPMVLIQHVFLPWLSKAFLSYMRSSTMIALGRLCLVHFWNSWVISLQIFSIQGRLVESIQEFALIEKNLVQIPLIELKHRGVSDRRKRQQLTPAD